MAEPSQAMGKAPLGDPLVPEEKRTPKKRDEEDQEKQAEGGERGNTWR